METCISFDEDVWFLSPLARGLSYSLIPSGTPLMLSRLDGAWAFSIAAITLCESPALAQTSSPSASTSAEAPPLASPPSPAASSAPSASVPAAPPPAGSQAASAPVTAAQLPAAPFSPTLGKVSAPVDESAPVPFGFADFTWLNGANRQREAVLDSPLFTGTAILDANYVYDFNQPIDHTISGSTVTV